ncbi:hypothetical protein ACWERY_02415 [Streptomyces sp. NPDC004082]
MKLLDMDSGLTEVVNFVREVHAPISQAITDGEPVSGTDCALLSGALDALLNAIDARRPQPEQPAAALKAA